MTASIAAVAPAQAAVTPAQAAVTPAQATAPLVRHADRSPSPSFHDVLSALNPLQYVPVIGTIYRAVTGDTIPEAVRRVGSLIVSALMGGPVGVAINLATMGAEKIIGVDLDRTAQGLLHGKSIGVAIADRGVPVSAAAGKAPASEPADPAADQAAAQASPARPEHAVTADRPGPGAMRDAEQAAAARNVPPASRQDALTQPQPASRHAIQRAAQGAGPPGPASPLAAAEAAKGVSGATWPPASGAAWALPPGVAPVLASGATWPPAPGTAWALPPGAVWPATLESSDGADPDRLNTRELSRILAASAAYARVAALAP